MCVVCMVLVGPQTVSGRVERIKDRFNRWCSDVKRKTAVWERLDEPKISEQY